MNLCFIIASLFVLVRSHSLNSRTAKIVSLVTYSAVGTTTTGTTRATLPTLPPFTNGTILPTATSAPIIDPRSQIRMSELETLNRYGENEEETPESEFIDESVNFPREKRQSTTCGCYQSSQGNESLALCPKSNPEGIQCATGFTYCCLPTVDVRQASFKSNTKHRVRSHPSLKHLRNKRQVPKEKLTNTGGNKQAFNRKQNHQPVHQSRSKRQAPLTSNNSKVGGQKQVLNQKHNQKPVHDLRSKRQAPFPSKLSKVGGGKQSLNHKQNQRPVHHSRSKRQAPLQSKISKVGGQKQALHPKQNHRPVHHTRSKRQAPHCGCFNSAQCAGSVPFDSKDIPEGIQCTTGLTYCCLLNSPTRQASGASKLIRGKNIQKPGFNHHQESMKHLRNKRQTSGTSKLTKKENEGKVVQKKIATPINDSRDKRQTTSCGCYPPAQCNSTNITDGTGLIDFRIVAGGTPTCATGLIFCCPSQSAAQTSCGARFTPTTSFTLTPGQARYGDFPWMVLIQNTTDGSYVGGGILIDTNNVLTTAHRIIRFINGTGLRIRLGEYDMNVTTEQYPYRDFTVGRFWVHESFNPGTLQNDVALLRLSASITTNPASGVVPICMPTTGQNFEGQRCWVAGWGVDQFVNGRLQTVLRAADVPIIAQNSCESSLRSTRLGNAWSLDRSSFICAGGEANKDACTGDGGSGLVCEVSTGRWVLAGLVAWGIGCATQGVPAAYVNVVNYLPWIQTRVAQ